MEEANKRIYFSGINTLRFIAAFSIIIYHSTLNLPNIYAPLKMFLHNLVIGVDLFFIISGFLITYLLIKEKSTTDKISLYKFFLRRILRIFPLYYMVIILSYLLFDELNNNVDYNWYYTFLGNFSLIANDTWTIAPLNPLWSICIEEHFYLVIPILVLILPKSYLNYLFVFIILLSLLFRLYITLTVEFNWMTIYAHTLSRCDLIAIGGLIAYQFDLNREKLFISKRVFLISIIYFLTLMCILDYGDYSSLIYATLKKYLFAILLVVIFLGTIFSNFNSISLSWLKENKGINYLGKISFGLYMYHSFVIYYVHKISFLNEASLLRIIVIIILTVIISGLSYELFEKQILKLKRRYEVVKSKTSNIEK